MSVVPSLPGVLGPSDVAATGRWLARMQEPDGAVPWAEGDRTDAWNHVEAAMALLLAGQDEAAALAYDWCLATQRADGSWPRTVRRGVVTEPDAETNMTAYLAVGVWHHWLLRRDRSFVRRCWPAVRRALDFVVAHQLGFGGIAWTSTHGATEALLAGSSSTYQSLRCGIALAELAGEAAVDWEVALAGLGHAVRRHEDRFGDKRSFSMDWYYPVLGGVVRDEVGRQRLQGRWEDFVVPGLGVRCVDTDPWVTGAETCELVLALDALGDRGRARRLLRDVQHLRREDGSYWTGYVYPDDAMWPVEQTTYTAAAVLLATDALSGSTPAAGLFRGDGLPAETGAARLGCDCPDPLSAAAPRRSRPRG